MAWRWEEEVVGVWDWEEWEGGEEGWDVWVEGWVCDIWVEEGEVWRERVVGGGLKREAVVTGASGAGSDDGLCMRDDGNSNGRVDTCPNLSRINRVVEDFILILLVGMLISDAQESGFCQVFNLNFRGKTGSFEFLHLLLCM